MRPTTTLLTALAFLAACDNSPEPTAVSAAQRGAATSSLASSPSNATAVSVAGKPGSGTGFTTVSTVTGPMATVTIFYPNATAIATCPAGTTLVGGGHQITNGYQTHIMVSGPNGANGWRVLGVFEAADGTFGAYALCAS